MKTKLLFWTVMVVAMARLEAASPAELLEKGIYTEETRGELLAAAEIYKQIVDDSSAPRGLAAQAQLRLGMCELKLGNKRKAISVLERLTQEFPDGDQLMALVDNQMPALLDEMVKQIEQNYIQEVDRNELVETAIRAIIGKLDSRGGLGFLRTNDMEFLGANELGQINEELEQQIVGIGAVLKVDGGQMVATPMRGSPALRAGLKADDRIIKVNGADVLENQLAQTVKALRGAAGSKVRVTVKRPGVDDLLQFEVTRGPILLPSVKGVHYREDDTWEFMLDETRKIGYVRVTQMGKQTAKELAAALNELQGRGLKGLVLDLRANPGGLLSEAIAVADLFVAEGTIVTVKSRSEEKVHSARQEDSHLDFPMVVLVNGQTASAAEIVAGCLQDHGRAAIIGERTFGQAIVRQLLPLKSGGALKLPVAAYYRPSGKHVNRYPGATEADEWGIKPDAGYDVALTEEEVKQLGLARLAMDSSDAPQTFTDRQLEKALEFFR